MKSTKWPVALLCGMVLALPLAAQEEPVPAEPPPPPTETKPAKTEPAEPTEPPKAPTSTEPALHRWGGWTLFVAAWQPALVSADEEIASTVADDTLTPVMAGSSARIRETAEVTYHLPHDAGAIVGHYDGMYQSDMLKDFTPGQFNFLETRGFPFALGAFDDGLADGVESNSLRKTRDFRLEFARTAFESKVARGVIRGGYRQLSHDRQIEIISHAIVPNLPPAIPPSIPDSEDPLRLQPLPDVVTQRSNFFGRGVGAALDVEFPLHPRFAITTGISIGLVRGDSTSAYVSTSSYYFINGAETVPLTKDQLFAILSTGTPDQIGAVNQKDVVVGTHQHGTDQFAVTYDIYVGIEGTVYRGLKLFARLRDVYYANVGEYVVPTGFGSNERTSLNAGYEGYNIGLSWRF
jgi:hypothetical protein